MCNFMQTSVDRIGSQAYTVSHGRQTTPTKDSRKGYMTMSRSNTMMMCMCMCSLLRQSVPVSPCAKSGA